jgi:acid phosphatase (class A)
MNRRSLLLLLVLTTQLFVPRLQAASPLKYLSAGSPDPVALLPPPPEAGTAEAAADLATTRTASTGRTPGQAAEAAAEDQLSIFSFAPSIGPWFQPGRFPTTEAFFSRIDSDTRTVTGVGKSYFQRPRPYIVDPTIAPLTRETSYSYPSGHSTRATVFALVLAELLPAHRDALLSFGRDIGWNRIVAGVHYPSDILTGRVLGRAIVAEMLKNPAFLHDLAGAKAEVAAARLQ